MPDDRVTVIDLKDRKIIDTVKTGAGAAGISITKDGKRAYVTNRMAGSISILAHRRQAGEPGQDRRRSCTAAALLSHIALSPDGKTGVATRNGDGKVVVVKLGGDALTEKATLDVAPRPYARVDDARRQDAVVASLGDPKANGMLTVIDLSGDPPARSSARPTSATRSLEGMMMSSDGKWIAGVAHGGSTRPKDAPQYKPNGMVVLYRLDGDKLTKVSEAPIGAWSQGASFSKDGKTVVVGKHDPEEHAGVQERRRQAHRHRTEDPDRRRRRGDPRFDGSMTSRRNLILASLAASRRAGRGLGHRAFPRSRSKSSCPFRRAAAPMRWRAPSRSRCRRRSARR